MNGDEFKCVEHSGLVARITNLEEEMNKETSRTDTIMSRLNVVLGGVAVSCILLVLNLIAK